MTFRRLVTFRCACGAVLKVPRAVVDKLPPDWTCPVCLDQQLDDYLTAQETRKDEAHAHHG